MTGVQPGVVAAVAAAATGVLAHGAFHRNSPVFGRVLTRVPSRGHDGRPLVALTFDDGPDPDTTPRVLDLLAAADVPATFFLLGRHVARWPALARRIAADGHAIGNHGWEHRRLTFRGPRYVHRDLARGAHAIADATGYRPRFFRAPHGFRNPWVALAARAQAEVLVGWTLGVRDTDMPGTDVIVRRVLRGVRPGAIVLLHDGDGSGAGGDRRQTADALPAILDGLRGGGYVFTRLQPVYPAAH